MPIIIFEISQTKAWEIWNKAPPPNNNSYPYSATSHTDAFPKNLMKNVIHKKKWARNNEWTKWTKERTEMKLPGALPLQIWMAPATMVIMYAWINQLHCNFNLQAGEILLRNWRERKMKSARREYGTHW